jgi:hypothetical protein
MSACRSAQPRRRPAPGWKGALRVRAPEGPRAGAGRRLRPLPGDPQRSNLNARWPSSAAASSAREFVPISVGRRPLLLAGRDSARPRKFRPKRCRSLRATGRTSAIGAHGRAPALRHRADERKLEAEPGRCRTQLAIARGPPLGASGPSAHTRNRVRRRAASAERWQRGRQARTARDGPPPSASGTRA